MDELGAQFSGWTARPRPTGERLTGRACRLDRTDVDRDAARLFSAYRAASEPSDWNYLPYGPFASEGAFAAWLSTFTGDDPLFYTVVADDVPSGLAAFMRIDPPNGVIEIGHLHFAQRLQKTVAATETVSLLLAHVFDDLGYRRVEWKCDAANSRSRRAAERFGFTFEGTFRQHRIVKGHNRDTAWFSMLDREWPATKTEFQRWLDVGNFDPAGRQLTSLRPTSR